MTESLLTEEEAEQLYRLLNKLDQEMDNMLEQSDSPFATEGVSYTTIVRDKKKRYLETVYNVDPDELGQS